MPSHFALKLLWFVLGAALLSGCDQLAERAGIPNQARLEAEGMAIGSACRHAGRGLEDCYRLNKDAAKSAIYAGWKEMNEYMVKNNMPVVTPSLPAEPTVPVKSKKKIEAEPETGEAEKKE
jgi:hypothetical protein